MATRIPMSFTVQLAYNNMNYFKSGYIFSSDKYMPALNKTIEFFGKLKFSRPFLNDFKAVFSIGVAQKKDFYSQSENIDLRGFRYDANRHNIFGGSVKFTGNTLNSTQYPTSGRSETIIAQIFTENDIYMPGNLQSYESRSVDRSWLQGKILFENYFKLSGHMVLGTHLEGYYSSRNFSSNYYASIMQAGHFRPTANSQFIFDPDLISNVYFAAGVKPIWVINNIFHIRTEAYVFQPTRPILNNEGQAAYGKPLSGTQIMGELNFVAQYNKISFNTFFNFSTTSYNPYTFGVTFGILMPNEWFIE